MAYPHPKLRWAVFVGIALLAFVIRLPRLGERPMHTDEAVNASITGQLLADDKYQYDPQDRHGPALYLAALPVTRSAGAHHLADLSEVTVRLVPVVWGVLTVLLFAAAARQIGVFAAVTAALLFAMGPLPVYYNRYFIHETLFVAATLGFLISGWRALESRSLGAGVMMGIAAGFMLACKETALLHFTAFGLAGLWWLVIRRNGCHWQALFKIGLIAFAAFTILVLAFYTWGGQHWQGPLDLIRSIPRFASRAGGEGHEKPFWYYLALLGGGWSGCGVLALAAIGAFTVVRRTWRASPELSDLPPGFGVRQSSGAIDGSKAAEDCRADAKSCLLVYTIAIGFIYSAIPYKTPWLALNLWLPLSLLAGCGFAAVWHALHKPSTRIALALAACVLVATLGWDTWQRAFARPADERNPYAYAHTVEDLLQLPKRLEQLAREMKPAGELRIAVIAADPWPLPWYLRKFPQVGYWQPGQDCGSADVYITSPEAAEKLAPKLDHWRTEYFGVRPEVLILLWTPPATDLSGNHVIDYPQNTPKDANDGHKCVRAILETYFRNHYEDAPERGASLREFHSAPSGAMLRAPLLACLAGSPTEASP